MKIKDLIKELDILDKQLDVKCSLMDGTTYDIVRLDIGNHINGRRTAPFGKIVISSFNIKK